MPGKDASLKGVTGFDQSFVVRGKSGMARDIGKWSVASTGQLNEMNSLALPVPNGPQRSGKY